MSNKPRYAATDNPPITPHNFAPSIYIWYNYDHPKASQTREAKRYVT